MPWGAVFVGYDVSDETINFGTRAIAVSDGNLYESATLATISKDENETDVINEPPTCLASCTPRGIVITSDETITVLDAIASVLKFSVHLDAVIECLEVSEDGSIIVCGLSNGNLVCLSEENNGKVLCSIPVHEAEKQNGSKIFSKINVQSDDTVIEVFVLLTNGEIVKKEIRNSNNEEFPSLISSTVLRSHQPYVSSTVYCQFFRNCDQISLFMADNNGYRLWSLNCKEDVIMERNISRIKKIQCINTPSNVIVCLCEDGFILAICGYTYQVISKWEEEKVKDIALFHNKGGAKITTELIILTDSPQPEICTMEIPDFQVKLRLKVNSPTYIFENQSDDIDLLYVEGFGEEKIIHTLRIKAIIEGSPDLRLARLLQRGKFGEAETFAKSWNLCLEEVHKAKVMWLKEKLSLLSQTPEAVEYFNQLISVLDKIEDVSFVAECCLKAIAPDLMMIQQIFDYAIKRIRSHPTEIDDQPSLLLEVIKSNVTLGTYMQVNENTTSPQNWLIFYSSNPIMICRNFLLRGEVQKAVIVCLRHAEKIKKEIPSGVAIELIQEVPKTVPIVELLKWLKAYIPVLLDVHPYMLQTLVTSIVDRTKHLELEPKSSWPDNGFYFVNEVVDILRNLHIKGLDLKISLSAENHSSSGLDPLLFVSNVLQQLSCLKKEYSIVISFEEYLSAAEKNDQLALMILILSYVSEHYLPSFLPGFFSKYCAKYYMEKDSVLLAYVIKIFEHGRSWNLGAKLESRIITFIGYMQNTQYKMQAIDAMLPLVNVPWSPKLSALVDYALKVDHPLAENMCSHKKTVQCKLILKKYDLFDADGEVETSQLIEYIYSLNRGNMVEDAKELVNMKNPAEQLLPYEFYLIHVVNNGEIEKGLQLLRNDLEKDQQVAVAKFAILHFLELLKNRNITAVEEVEEAIPILFEYLSVLNPEEAKSIETDVRLNKRFVKLKKQSNVHLSLDVVYSKEKREIALHEALLKMRNEENPDTLAKNVVELAQCLRVSKEAALLELIYIFACSGQLDRSATFLRLFLDCGCTFNESTKVFDIMCIYLKYISEYRENLPHDQLEVLLKVTTKVYMTCNPRFALKAAEFHSAFKLCLSSKANVKHNFSNIFAEKIEMPSILPPETYIRKIIRDHWTFDNDIPTPIEEIEKSLQSLPNTLSSIPRLRTYFMEEGMTNPAALKKAMEEKVLRILPSVISSRSLDLELSLSLLGFLDVSTAITWLQNSIRRDTWSNLKKSSDIAQLGLSYVWLSQTNDVILWRFFHDFYQKIECFRKIQQFGIHWKVAEKLCDTNDGKKNLLFKLMKVKDVDTNFLYDICQDLKFDFQVCLRLYLEHTLLSWEPVYEERVDPVTGKSEIILLSKKEDLAEKCSQITALITTKNEIVDYLKKCILPKVNFYYYEVFMVLINVILNLSISHQEVLLPHQILLNFLSNYRRISTVSREETDYWFNYFPDLTSLPPISKYRLPFSQLPSDPWKIIRPEVSLKTYKLWLATTQWLNINLDKDYICSLAIMNMIGEITNNSEWNLHRQCKTLMAEIAECISMIESSETAVAAFYAVVNHIMPPGADRVEAAMRCLMAAQDWYQREHSENAKIGLQKAKKKYLNVSTHHFLYKYHLAKPEYLALALQPLNLITALYHDQSILETNRDSISPQPDINVAVSQIASVHCINDEELQKVFKELLTEWLQSTQSMNSSFQEVYMMPKVSYSENIIRACYLLSGFQKMESLVLFLVNLAVGKEGVHTQCTGIMLGALQSLRAALTPKDLEKLTSMDLVAIDDLIMNLDIISKLEKFALNYSVKEFKNTSKSEIVEVLLNYACPEAFALSTKILLTYNIDSSRLWNSILANLSTLKMVKMLEYCLPEIKHISHILNEEILLKAWEFLIFSVLSQLEKVSSGQQDIDKSFSLVESCPVITSLNLKKIQQIYCDLQHPELAEMIAKFE